MENLTWNLQVVLEKVSDSGHITGLKINFFNNLPVGQVISNVYLPEEILTCPKEIGTISFEVVYLWKKICKMYCTSWQIAEFAYLYPILRIKFYCAIVTVAWERESLFFELKHKLEFTNIAKTKKCKKITNELLHLVHRGVAKDHIPSVACRSPSLRLL